MKKQIEKTVWSCACENCPHIWETRDGEIPKVCPKCKSKNWDKSSGSEERSLLLEISDFGRLKTSEPFESDICKMQQEEFRESEREIVPVEDY